MVTPEYFEELSTSIAALQRPELMRRLLHFKGRPRLDFTEDYLMACTVDKLRHILYSALATQARRR